MVTFQFGILKKVTRHMQPQGKRHYQIDYDRPVHITDHKGEIIHRYLDENVWRDQQGRVVQPQQTQETRGLTDYLKDWDNPEQSGDSRKNASGADSHDGDHEYSVPYRAPMPENPEWGLGKDGGNSYGHSDDVVEKDDYKAWPGIDRDDVARGYSLPKSDGEGGVLSTRQPNGSYPQSLPKSNEYTTHDRSREFRGLEEGAHPGTGNDNPHPGTEQLGSRANQG
jgi:hypothetical protein